MRKKQGFSGVGLVVTAVIVAAIAVLAWLVVVANTQFAYMDAYEIESVIAGDEHNGGIADHVKGDPETAVAVIYEYADYQCPSCASMNPYVNQAVEETNGKLAVVYRSYLLSYHQNAPAAAAAAEAAGLQGHWKEFADLLFLNQSGWEYASASERTELFNEYFEEATGGEGNLAQFNADQALDTVQAKIDFDMRLGKKAKVGGTPAFYYDGQLIDWSNSEGGEIAVNGYTIGWDSRLNGEQFVQILKDIVKFAEM